MENKAGGQKGAFWFLVRVTDRERRTAKDKRLPAGKMKPPNIVLVVTGQQSPMP